MKIYDTDSILTFGRYKNKSVQQIIEKDCLYIRWCMYNLDHFVLSENVINLFFEKIDFNKHVLPLYIKDLFFEGTHPDDITLESISLFETTFLKNSKELFEKKLRTFKIREEVKLKNQRYTGYTDYNDVEDKSYNSANYNFVRDVLGGDPSAIWNID